MFAPPSIIPGIYRDASLDLCNRLGSTIRLPQWSKDSERDAGRMRLDTMDRVEGGDSRQTGSSRTTSQDVPLKAPCGFAAAGASRPTLGRQAAQSLAPPLSLSQLLTLGMERGMYRRGGLCCVVGPATDTLPTH